MDITDPKRQLKTLYTAPKDRFVHISVPALSYLMVDGAGDPNTAPAYVTSVSALYSLSYGLKFHARQRVAKDHVVGPLEGLWWAHDTSDVLTRRKDNWLWTLMIWQPDWITLEIVAEAKAALGRKRPDLDLSGVHLERWEEGDCFQALHIGPYDAEGPLLKTLHDNILPGSGWVESGHHHEIYLSDSRRTAPGKLKTVLRQPVKPVIPA